MKSETKLFLGIIIGTVALVGIGIAFLSRPAPVVKVNSDVLVRSDSNKLATGSSVLTLVEFSDFQCPACGSYQPILKQLIAKYASQMTFVYRNFPLTTIHKNAFFGAQAAEAAAIQGKYWEMHDMLFDHQTEWSTLDNPRDRVFEYAKTLGLNIEQFTKDIDSEQVKAKIENDIADGNSLGINATPTFFLNGEKLENPSSGQEFDARIKAVLEKNDPLRK